ncbi:MAG: DUF3991 and toprim domain-containing protein [Acetobacter sp.]|nr:DUF3991 and toprim domain-containing protein [Bacteroides sp.]MCM1341872.1 DUF3991 and toprim domain-containing protein [Acetobacter sp.]MCM1433169.1 DUF3991 and toprim domain-containing protein [Clostridiales bacterium]
MPYYSKETIAEVKKIDLLTYLENYEPNELVKLSDGIYTTREHDSLKISNGLWFWWSRGFGGRSALKYLTEVRGMSFIDAVDRIVNKTAIQPAIPSKIERKNRPEKLILPDVYRYATNVANYLTQVRGIDSEIVDYCIQKGFIYESKRYHSAVFVGYDSNNVAKYAAFRACDGSRVMGDCSGSSKEYSFRLIGSKSNDTVHLFESAIDVMSYATLIKMVEGDWQKHNLISLSGVYMPKKEIKDSKVPIALVKYFEEYPNTKQIYLHLDNDIAGRKMTKALKIILPNDIKVIDNPTPFGKDVNDFLLIKKGIIKPFKYDWRNDKSAKKQSLCPAR